MLAMSFWESVADFRQPYLGDNCTCKASDPTNSAPYDFTQELTNFKGNHKDIDKIGRPPTIGQDSLMLVVSIFSVRASSPS